MLRTALEQLEPKEQAVVQKCVAKKLLSMGKDLPQWILDTYKVLGGQNPLGVKVSTCNGSKSTRVDGVCVFLPVENKSSGAAQALPDL